METKQKVVIGAIGVVGLLVGGAMLWETMRMSGGGGGAGGGGTTVPQVVTPSPGPNLVTPVAPVTQTSPDQPTPQPTPIVIPSTTNPPQTTPGPAQTSPSPTTTTAENDRIRFGSTLPFPIPGLPGLETEGGALVAGEATFPNGEGGGGGSITRLADADGNVWVMVEIEPSNKKSLLGRSIATAERVVPPYLIVEGADGQVGALGFVYQDGQRRVVLVEPQLGLRGISQAPELIASRQDQKMWLLFRAPKGGVIRSLWFGRKKKVEWEPGVKIPG
jgi:hypothetical protein